MKAFRKIIPLIFIMVLICLCSFTCSQESAELTNVDADTGIIKSATLTISSLPQGEYDLCYGDEGNEWINKYTKITTLTQNEDGEAELTIENVVIPPDVKTLVLVKDNATYYLDQSIEIPEECLNFGENELVFGALSDVHFNRYYALEPLRDEAEISFDIALDFFEQVDADLVCISGDLSKNGERSAFEKYNELTQGREFEIFTCTGNHDVKALITGLWQEYITAGLDSIEGVSDIASNKIDFVYSETEQDVFVFLSQMYWDYGTNESRLLENEQLEWLGGVFEKYKDKRVYLFFHTFLYGPDGQSHTGVGNLRNPGGYEYDLPYTYGAEDEVELRRLLKQYKNVIFFSGHSHWMFELEIYNENANFSSFGGEYGYMVHVPSVTEPRYIGENDTSRTGKAGESSQGWLIYSYDDCIILLPYDFILGVCYTEYMEIISYE